MLTKISIRTKQRDEMIDITRQIQVAVEDSGVKEGIVTVFVPHTTGGITINENADRDVVTDIIKSLDELYPWENAYRHFEGNSAAHLKASTFGFSETVIISQGKLQLGTWQGIYFCEFDGPRTRTLMVKVIKG